MEQTTQDEMAVERDAEQDEHAMEEAADLEARLATLAGRVVELEGELTTAKETLEANEKRAAIDAAVAAAGAVDPETVRVLVERASLSEPGKDATELVAALKDKKPVLFREPTRGASAMAARGARTSVSYTHLPGAMRVLLSVEQLDDDPPIADRWSMYHGEPEDVRWAAFWVDFAKWSGIVVDGDALMDAHPFAADEGSLVKELNGDAERLRSLCDEVGGMRDVEAPVAVGVDALGVNVRARFDIVRLPFAEEARSAEDARRLIAGLGA